MRKRNAKPLVTKAKKKTVKKKEKKSEDRGRNQTDRLTALKAMSRSDYIIILPEYFI